MIHSFYGPRLLSKNSLILCRRFTLTLHRKRINETWWLWFRKPWHTWFFLNLISGVSGLMELNWGQCAATCKGEHRVVRYDYDISESTNVN